MLFNSLDFAVFLPLVFLIYWLLINRLKLQNLWVLVASYVFYGWWDYRFLSLILFSTLVDFFIAALLGKEENPAKRRIYLWLSILVNLGFLGFFKYFNFFIDNFRSAFTFFGSQLDFGGLDIVLPVGISFYSFQTLSYTIDVYKRKLAPTQDFIAFSAFVSFFPQLVAGPIERASNLLPQFYKKRQFEYSHAVDGLRQMLWGLFKKIVIADNCSELANQIFNHSDQYGGSTILLGALFFTFQIYGDFSGYSDIALGTSRLFGFSLMRNFAFPYFSRDIAEFWRRWHISLSTWFRDYLYIPLGGSQGGMYTKIKNTFIIFLVSGFWHGANWTFIFWGLLNAIYFLPLLLSDRNRVNLHPVAEGRHLPSAKELLQMITTFGLVVFAWIFFRASSLHHAWQCIQEIFSKSLFSLPKFEGLSHAMLTLILITIFMLLEWMGRERQYALANFGEKWPKVYRYGFYYMLMFTIFWFGGKEQEFIYFQF
jgi:alginate O-acetyltransferase complex protein AlgI